MADFDMQAASAEFERLSQEPTQEVEQAAQAQPEQEASAKPTAEQIANFFETQLDGKPLKLPYGLELPLKHNGQMMNVPLEKLANTYRQFEHIQSKHKEFQTKQQEFEQKVGDWNKVEAMKGKYGAIQDWSEQNPEAFEKLWQMFQTKDQILASNEFNPIIPEVNSLKEQLAQIKQETEWYRTQREQQAAEKDVQMIEQQMTDWEKEYPFLPLDEKDLDGIDLKSRIIQFGIDNSHKDFMSAAFAFPGLRERLVTGIRESVKAEEAKRIKQDSKNGIIARATTPGSVKAGDPITNVKRLSPQDRDSLMLEELSKAF